MKPILLWVRCVVWFGGHELGEDDVCENCKKWIWK